MMRMQEGWASWLLSPACLWTGVCGAECSSVAVDGAGPGLPGGSGDSELYGLGSHGLLQDVDDRDPSAVGSTAGCCEKIEGEAHGLPWLILLLAAGLLIEGREEVEEAAAVVEEVSDS